MSTFKSATTIVVGTIASTGLTVLRDLLYGNINVKPIIGGFITGAFLMILAFWSIEVAAALALLMLVTSVLRNAPRIMSKVAL